MRNRNKKCAVGCIKKRRRKNEQAQTFPFFDCIAHRLIQAFSFFMKRGSIKRNDTGSADGAGIE